MNELFKCNYSEIKLNKNVNQILSFIKLSTYTRILCIILFLDSERAER